MGDHAPHQILKHPVPSHFCDAMLSLKLGYHFVLVEDGEHELQRSQLSNRQSVPVRNSATRKKKISFWGDKKLTITFAGNICQCQCDWEFASGNIHDDSCWPDGSKSPIYFPIDHATSFGTVALSIVWTGILAKCSRVSIPTFFVVVDFFLHLKMWSSCKVVALSRNKMTLKRTLWAARRPEMKFDLATWRYWGVLMPYTFHIGDFA